MKLKSLIIFFLIGLITSCSENPEDNQPTSLTTFEQQFVGTWYVKRKTENNLVLTSSDTAFCKFVFKNTPQPGLSDYFECDLALEYCLLSWGYWNGASPYINLNGIQYQIIEQTGSSFNIKKLVVVMGLFTN